MQKLHTESRNKTRFSGYFFSSFLRVEKWNVFVDLQNLHKHHIARVMFLLFLLNILTLIRSSLFSLSKKKILSLSLTLYQKQTKRSAVLLQCINIQWLNFSTSHNFSSLYCCINLESIKCLKTSSSVEKLCLKWSTHTSTQTELLTCWEIRVYVHVSGGGIKCKTEERAWEAGKPLNAIDVLFFLRRSNNYFLCSREKLNNFVQFRLSKKKLIFLKWKIISNFDEEKV
jgi:hypothetical protein